MSRSAKSDLRAAAARLGGITLVELEPPLFRRVRLHRNNAHYAFLMLLCEFYAMRRLLAQRPVKHGFHDPRPGTAQSMGILFEHFVFNFARVHFPHLRVTRPHLSWHAKGATDLEDDLLPRMKTDTVIASADGRRVVVETKFYQEVLVRSSATAKAVLRSGHLYQLVSYCRALSSSPPAPGLLLYAQSGRRLRLERELLGHAIAVRTLDLAQPWQEVEQELFAIVASAMGAHDAAESHI